MIFSRSKEAMEQVIYTYEYSGVLYPLLNPHDFEILTYVH